MWCPWVMIKTLFQNQGDVLARPKVLGAVQASDPQSRAASRHHQRFAFAINFHWQLWLISGEGDMNMMFSESNLVRNIFSKMSEISVIYTVQILPRTDKASVNPFGHMVFSGFSGSGCFWRGPWENHCNGDELLSEQVLQSHPGHNLV